MGVAQTQTDLERPGVNISFYKKWEHIYRPGIIISSLAGQQMGTVEVTKHYLISPIT